MSTWRVTLERGSIRLPQIGWWLDAHFPADRSFVSHAHFDHLAAHRTVLLSETTGRLMRARMPGERTEITLPFNTPWNDGDRARFTLVPAGHIFGSAQSLIECELGSLLYTGDFKLRPGLSAERCETPRADVLIMETTYGKPHYRFPPTEEVLDAMVRFCEESLSDGVVPVLFGYSLGKSQEILSGLERARLPVMLHPQTWKLTKVYEQLGIRFPPHREFDAENCDGHVVIAPPQSSQSPWLRRLRSRRTASLTGWALDTGARFRNQVDAIFPLSDHADYPDLMEFVRRVQPSVVHTVHGFAEEFAADLRKLGIEAWALGRDRQLDLSLTFDSSRDNAPTQHSPSPSLETAAETASFRRFSEVADQLARLPGRLEKQHLLRDLLRSLETEEAALASVYATGRSFPQSESLRIDTGWSLARQALAELSPLSPAQLRATSSQHLADAGEIAEAMLAACEKRTLRSWSLTEVDGFLRSLARTRGARAKLELLREAFSRSHPIEAKYLVKLLTGDLRIGLRDALVEDAIAEAYGRPNEEIRRAHLLCGDLGRVLRAAETGNLASIRPVLFHPVQFMLASPAPDAATLIQKIGTPLWLEEKYDGIRCQVHKAADRVELYSRDLHPITHSFADLAREVASMPGDFVADGELIAFRDGRALPFQELQRRLGKKMIEDDLFEGATVPVALWLYDLLWLGEASLLDLPLRERRQQLEKLTAEANREAIVAAPVRFAHDALEVEAAFLAAKARGNEGLMAKDPASPYAPGRRGQHWMKLKKAQATLEVVVVAVEYGHGKRRGVLSDYTFAVRHEESGEFLVVGKAYSGLTDAEIAELTPHFLERTVRVDGRVRRVLPDTVIEVAFDSIQTSSRHASGYSLRFPRIVRLRTDRTPADIDTVATCARLAASSFTQPNSEAAT